MIKFGHLAYRVLKVYAQPNVLEHAAMVVQFGYRAGAARCAKAFDCIVCRVRPLSMLLPTYGKEAPAAREQMLEALKGGDTVLLVFQAKQVVYIEEVGLDGVKVKKQKFVGSSVTFFADVSGIADLEGPFFSGGSERFDYLWAQVQNLIKPSSPAYITD